MLTQLALNPLGKEKKLELRFTGRKASGIRDCAIIIRREGLKN